MFTTAAYYYVKILFFSPFLFLFNFDFYFNIHVTLEYLDRRLSFFCILSDPFMMLLQSLSIVFVIAAVVVSVAASSPSSPRSSNSMNHDQECTNNQGNTCSSSSSSSSSSYTTRPPRRVTVYQPICNYYLAPSSIPNSGFGTYTIRDIPQNTLLMQQADAPTIVLSDAARHDQLNTDLQQRDPTKMVQPLPVHYNYFWDGSGFADFEVDGRVEISVTTFGAMANYHPFLFNLYPTVEELDDSIVPRSSGSPGIGAFSYNMGYNYVSSRTIQKGEELFTTYGMYLYIQVNQYIYIYLFIYTCIYIHILVTFIYLFLSSIGYYR